MKSIIDGSNLKHQYKNGFPLPKPDSFGMCSNYDSAHFMMDDESSCVQLADLETECTNVLNSQFYSTKLQYALGQGAPDNTKITVTLGDVYIFDETTSKYTLQPGADETFILSTAGTDANDASICTCSNYMREVQYTV